jgi:hypothetical protein
LFLFVRCILVYASITSRRKKYWVIGVLDFKEYVDGDFGGFADFGD